MMKHVRIKQIKSIGEVRECFSFFKRIMFDINQESLGVFTSFHETYQTMLDNIEKKEKLQFVAELDDEIVGCIIASPEEESTLFLPVLAVDDMHRRLGIAHELINTLVKSLKPKKYKILKVISSQEFAGFFVKLGFSPFLYVEPLEAITINQIEAANGLGLEKVKETQNYVKFALPEFDESYAKAFKRKLRLVNAIMTFEKTI